VPQSLGHAVRGPALPWLVRRLPLAPRAHVDGVVGTVLPISDDLL